MIGKQVKGRSFRGLLNYLYGQEGAERIGGNMVGENPRELSAEFRFSRQLNTNLGRCVYHASLSLPKHEELDNDTWCKIAEDYLKGMGFDYNQFVVVRHHRKKKEEGEQEDCDHIHIAASRIKLNGRTVEADWDYSRSEKLIRQLEKKYNLESPIEREDGRRSPTTGERRLLERTGEESERTKLQNIIDEAAVDQPLMPQLIERLQKQGIECRFTYYDNGDTRGISYKKGSAKFSGTQLGKAYTFPGLQKHRGVSYDKQRDDDLLKELSNARAVQVGSEWQALPVAGELSAWDMRSLRRTERHLNQLEKLQQEPPNQEVAALNLKNQAHAQVVKSVNAENPSASEISPQQLQLAFEIVPIAERAFYYALDNARSRVAEGEDFTQVNVADQYNLIVNNDAMLSSLIATDGRGELIRIESEQLTKAQGLGVKDVEVWKVIEQRLDDQTERAASTDSADSTAKPKSQIEH